MSTYFVYFLKNTDWTYSTGITNDLTRALERRNASSHYDMIAVEKYASVSQALERQQLFEKFQSRSALWKRWMKVYNLLPSRSVSAFR